MSITIENPTAETIYAALQNVPASEIERLRALLNARRPLGEDASYSEEWSDEDLRDAQRTTGLLIEKRFGSEEHGYD